MPVVRSSSEGRRGLEPLVGDHTISCCADEGMNSGNEIFNLRRLMTAELFEPDKEAMTWSAYVFWCVIVKDGRCKDGVEAYYCSIRFKQ